MSSCLIYNDAIEAGTGAHWAKEAADWILASWLHEDVPAARSRLIVTGYSGSPDDLEELDSYTQTIIETNMNRRPFRLYRIHKARVRLIECIAASEALKAAVFQAEHENGCSGTHPTAESKKRIAEAEKWYINRYEHFVDRISHIRMERPQ
jgi:hypothetical protein